MIIILFFLLFALILIFPDMSLSYAANGLLLWFNCMVPALFPFMILSGILVRQNLTEAFSSFFYPIIGPLYKISKNGVYCMLLGFLCGFPMGARVIADLYERNKISKKEASYLLAFCNNIGPVYFITFLLPVIGLTSIKRLPLYLFGMYGIPLLYGIFLRNCGFLLPKQTVCKCEYIMDMPNTEDFAVSLDGAMQSAIHGITTLGGYMILFNLFNIVPQAILKILPLSYSDYLLPVINCILEITGGVKNLGIALPYFVLTLLPFGGLSCIAQTKSMVQNTDLSIFHYTIHKLIQTAVTGLYYFLLCLFFL